MAKKVKKKGTLLSKLREKFVLSQVIFIGILLFVVVGSILIKAPFIRLSDFSLFLIFSKQLIIPALVFIILIKLLLPELSNLFKTESGFGPSFIKRGYYIFVFYLMTSVLLQFIVDRYIGWFTSLGSLGPDYSLIYANTVTPLIIFLVRKAGSEESFKSFLYVNIVLMLFVIFLEIPVGGYNLLFNKFLDIVSGILIPVYVFALLDLVIPQGKIKTWFTD
jgi:hypothetical protein